MFIPLYIRGIVPTLEGATMTSRLDDPTRRQRLGGLAVVGPSRHSGSPVAAEAVTTRRSPPAPRPRPATTPTRRRRRWITASVAPRDPHTTFPAAAPPCSTKRVHTIDFEVDEHLLEVTEGRTMLAWCFARTGEKGDHAGAGHPRHRGRPDRLHPPHHRFPAALPGRARNDHRRPRRRLGAAAGAGVRAPPDRHLPGPQRRDLQLHRIHDPIAIPATRWASAARVHQRLSAGTAAPPVLRPRPPAIAPQSADRRCWAGPGGPSSPSRRLRRDAPDRPGTQAIRRSRRRPRRHPEA